MNIRMEVFALAMVGIVGCAPLPEFPYGPDADLVPPQIVGLAFESSRRIVVGFDEECRLVEDSVVPGESLSAVSAHWDGDEATGSALEYRFQDPPEPGIRHWIEAQVADTTGNHLRFVTRFYGLNDLIPAMVINEFTCQGSGSHPDFVEIRILTAGNLAGACIYEGVPSDWTSRFVFPDVDVIAGDYLIVHFRPEGTAEEVNEVLSRDQSGGNDTSPEAWDFWVADGDGLPGNNGAITLCENPIGGIIDAVLYSNRTSESDERYRGFGSASVMKQADYLASAGAWSGSDPVRPEDGVNPEDSTATRSISRMSDGSDTNSRVDWHITPTRGLTPGRANSDEVY